MSPLTVSVTFLPPQTALQSCVPLASVTPHDNFLYCCFWWFWMWPLRCSWGWALPAAAATGREKANSPHPHLSLGSQLSLESRSCWSGVSSCAVTEVNPLFLGWMQNSSGRIQGVQRRGTGKVQCGYCQDPKPELCVNFLLQKYHEKDKAPRSRLCLLKCFHILWRKGQ